MKLNMGLVINRAVYTACSAKRPFPNLMQGHVAKREEMIQSGLKSKRIKQQGSDHAAVMTDCLRQFFPPTNEKSEERC